MIISFPMRPRLLLAIAALACAGIFAPSAAATSVVAPTFPELVAEAQSIVRAKVTDVRCAWADSPQGRVIKTYVTFTLLKRLKGPGVAEFTLEMLGGEIDGQGMKVSGMPQFAVGQTDILFIAGNGVRFCPLVAMMHGRYRVAHDDATARDYVARDDGVPLESVTDVQLPQEGDSPANRLKRAAAALTPEAFEAKIAAELSSHARP